MSFLLSMEMLMLKNAIWWVIGFHFAPVWAQSPANPTPLAQNKPAAATTQAKTKAPPQAEAEAPMGAEELAIAQRVHKGHLPCELGVSVRMEADADQPGYFYLHGKGFRYRMHPVATSTGAIRLEDRKAGAVWLQLVNKSMLMDQKKGRRVADECANAEQVAFAENMKINPPPSLIDTTGTGR